MSLGSLEKSSIAPDLAGCWTRVHVFVRRTRSFRQLRLSFLPVLLALAACSSAPEKHVRRNGRADPAASVTATSPAAGGATSTGTGAGGGSGAVGGSSNGTGQGSEGFETATEPTAIIAAYLTAYRDAPSTADVAADAITVFTVVRDQNGKPLPKPLALDLAVVSFDDGTEVVGTVDPDPQHDYHVIFRVPKAQLATQSIGKDQIKGRIKVGSPVFATPTLETDIVIWLANVMLTVEREDYGVLQLPNVGEPELALKLHVAVSGYEQPAQNALLKGLGGDLSVGGGTCPPLAESEPQDLKSDCDLELTPRDVMVLDRVLTLTYYNGIREDFASVILRGETALVLETPGGFDTLAAHDGKLLASTPAKRSYTSSEDRAQVLIWSEFPKRSGVAPDVVLGAWDDPPTEITSISRIVFAGDRLVALGAVTAPAGDPNPHAPKNKLLFWEQIPTSSSAKPDFEISMPYIAGIGSYDGKRLFIGEGRIYPDRPRFVVFEDVATGVPNPVAVFPDIATPMTITIGRFEYAGGRYFEINEGGLRIWEGKWPFDYLHADKTLGVPYSPPHVSALVRIEVRDSWIWSRPIATSDGTALVLADKSRVLVWEKWPTASDAPADFVLGQRDFVSMISNVYGKTVESLNDVVDVLIVGDKLAISDGRIVVRSLPRTRPKLELPPRPAVYLDGETAPGLLSFRSSYFELGIVDREESSERWLAVEYSGSTDVTMAGASFDHADFRFVGGAYPGSGGTCGTTIKTGCLLHVALADRRQGRRQAKLELEYENGVASRTASITLQASVRSVARESFNERRPLANGGANTLLAWDACVYVYRGKDLASQLASEPVQLFLPLPLANPDCFHLQYGIIDSYGSWSFATVSRDRLYTGSRRNVMVHRNVPEVSNVPKDFRLDLGWTPESNLSATTALAAGGRLYVSMCGAPSLLLVWSTVPDMEVGPDAVITYPAPYADACVTDLFEIEGRLVAGFVSAESGSGGLFVWDTPPGSAAAPSRIVTELSNPEAAAFQSTGRFAWDGTRFYAVDHGSHAVRVWFGLPDPHRAPDVVLGQLEKDGVNPDDGGVGMWSLLGPWGVAVAGDRVYVNDQRGVKAFGLPTP